MTKICTEKSGGKKRADTLLIFDHDGTLHDSMAIFGPAMRAGIAWLRENGFPEAPEISDARIASFLGMNSIDIWNSLIKDMPAEMCSRVTLVVGEEIRRNLQVGKARWFPHLTEQLDALKAEGYHCVILSNCEILLRDLYWEHFQIGTWFDTFYCCEIYGFRPKTEIIHEILKDYEGCRAIMIGDRENDFDCARSAGIPFIGCAYGFGSEKELEGADAIAEKPEQLAETIDKIASGWTEDRS